MYLIGFALRALIGRVQRVTTSPSANASWRACQGNISTIEIALDGEITELSLPLEPRALAEALAIVFPMGDCGGLALR
ncbi:hypothetical protein ASE00_14315 [Sphingomonas sp. Root710]|nr:hypothetical protein ASE00_14315 [Sphingomonas sp. Root710]